LSEAILEIIKYEMVPKVHETRIAKRKKEQKGTSQLQYC
jgi:hypothetical protein